MKKILLASTSVYRKELLARLGLAFDCIAPNVDELPYQQKILDPKELALTLAHAKAQAVATQFPEAIVIGSDQVACLGDEIFGKAGSNENAFLQLKKLSGKTHQLLTAFCVMSKEATLTKINATTLKMRNLTDLQIKNYLRLDNPVDCAASYKLELRGISLFEEIQTSDYTAIIGLPLIELARTLANVGVVIPPESD
jgi:septum formation protein